MGPSSSSVGSFPAKYSLLQHSLCPGGIQGHLGVTQGMGRGRLEPTLGIWAPRAWEGRRNKGNLKVLSSIVFPTRHSCLPCPGITWEKLIIHSSVGTSRKFLLPWVFKAIPSFILGIIFSNPINEAESKTLFGADEHKLDKYNSHWSILCIPCYPLGAQHCRTGVSIPCLPDFFGK